MQGYERDKLRRELDEALLPFRLARKRKGDGTGWGGTGWLKSIRQAVGVPVDEVARRLGVCRWEVHRLEESEKNSRIMLATLSRAAKGLGCELVYALIPKEGALEDLAAEERAASKRVLESKQEGFRVRPRKTERGVAKQQAEFAQTVKLAGMARVMGPLMSELAGQRAGKPVGERAEE